MALFDQGGEFFDLLERQADAARKAAGEFARLGTSFEQVRDVAAKLDQIESDADKLTHDVTARADARFITPFDKEDLHRLTVMLDDLVDLIEAAGARIVIYHIDKPRPDFEAFSKLLVQAMEAVYKSVCELRRLKKHTDLQNELIAVHSIEGSGDKLYREALDRLFGAPNPDALYVMKWKEIYDRLEMCMDRSEDVADTLETMAVKYA